MFKILKVFFACLVFSSSAKIPEFIVTCQRDDPNLNDCALKNARIAIPQLVKGYRPFGLPSLDPLNIPRIDIQAGSNLKIDLTNNTVHGIGNTWITDIDMQIDKQHMIFQVDIPKANILGHYKMNGKILILPIQGEGLANVTFLNGHYIYSMDYTLVPRKGKKYLTITTHNITFTTTRAYYHFDNLFNGDKNLGAQMNRFMDENWKDLNKDLGSTVSETISSIITSIAQSIFVQIPFDEVLPLK